MKYNKSRIPVDALAIIMVFTSFSSADAQFQFGFFQTGTNDILANLFLSNLPANDASQIQNLTFTDKGNLIYGLGTAPLSPFLLDGSGVIASDGAGGLGGAAVVILLDDTSTMLYQDTFQILNLTMSTSANDNAFDSLSVVGIYDDGTQTGVPFAGQAIGQWQSVPEPIGSTLGFLAIVAGVIARRRI